MLLSTRESEADCCCKGDKAECGSEETFACLVRRAPRAANGPPAGPAAALASWPELLGTRSQLLIDPQTCGPLLAAVPQPQAGPCLAAMKAAGFAQAALIGTVQRQEQF